LNSLEQVEKVQKWIKSLFTDPLTEILINNSHLTKIQAETLLIDNLAENVLDQKIGYELKAKMRGSLKGVSRGAFNRTLHQANKNIIASIYTIFFLGYLGILETPSLDGFIETSNKLATYVKEYRSILKGDTSDRTSKNKDVSLKTLKEELISNLNTIIPPKKEEKM
jgi:hypothetical protein